MRDLRLAFYIHGDLLFIATDDAVKSFKSQDRYLGDVFVSQINSFLSNQNYCMNQIRSVVFQDSHMSYTTSRLVGTYVKAMTTYFTKVAKQRFQTYSMSSLVPLVYNSEEMSGSAHISNMKGGAFLALFENKMIIEFSEDPIYTVSNEWTKINQAKTMLKIIDDENFIAQNNKYIKHNTIG